MATKALSFISSDNHYRYLLHDTAIYPQNNTKFSPKYHDNRSRKYCKVMEYV